MRIHSLEIHNFRAISRLSLSNLSDAVVIAGPNGCGKSSIFDAIRLVKSAYGGYQQNELATWFGEFHIDIQRLQTDSTRMLNDITKPLNITIKFQAARDEIEFLREHALEIYRDMNLSRLLRRRGALGEMEIVNPLTNRTDGQMVEAQARELSQTLLGSEPIDHLLAA